MKASEALHEQKPMLTSSGWGKGAGMMGRWLHTLLRLLLSTSKEQRRTDDLLYDYSESQYVHRLLLISIAFEQQTQLIRLSMSIMI